MALPGYWSDHTDLAAITYLKDSIDSRFVHLFNDRRDVLFDAKRGFTRRIFYTRSGERMDDNYRQEVPDYPELPDGYDIDPINQLIARYGENWEEEAWKATRPDIPVPEDIRQICPHPMLLYDAHRNGVSYKVTFYPKNTSIFTNFSPGYLPFHSQIRGCDPASLVCDVNNEGKHNIYPKVLCTTNRNIMHEVSPL